MVRATNYRIELKLALEQAGITQVQLARRIRCTPAHVSRIVRGHVTPNEHDRTRIAKILRKSEIELFPEQAKVEHVKASETESPGLSRS